MREKHIKRVGFLGCGKIGRFMLEYLLQSRKGQISFVQDPKFVLASDMHFPVVCEPDPSVLDETDLVVECANADVLKMHFDQIIERCDLMTFSVTAFGDPTFEAHAKKLAEQFGHRIYVPHGAILGLDGLFDGCSLISSVSVITTKNPASLGRADLERTVVYDGPTRQACRLFPRNVNVHAAVALAGIGFDQTYSIIVSDPTVNTNSHEILIEGDGICFTLKVNSFAGGSITGKYTPTSACGSLDRVLENGKAAFRFV